jgi:hypothetical protein
VFQRTSHQYSKFISLCAGSDLHVKLIILAHRSTRSSEQLVDLGMQPVCQMARRLART